MLRPSQKQFSLILIATCLITTPVIIHFALGFASGGPSWPVYASTLLIVGVVMWQRACRKK
jgi:hypothetical protein